MKHVDAWLATFLETLRATDPELAGEMRAIQEGGDVSQRSRSRVGRAVRAVRARRLAVRQSVRNIVLRVGRPVLAIVKGDARLRFKDSDGAVWRSRLEAAGPQLHRAALAVGRIDVTGLEGLDYVGTGWVIAPNTIITNRHVALAFARRGRAAFSFKAGTGRKPIAASVDFLAEAGRRARLVFPVVDILHIEDDRGPDMALLRLDPRSGVHELAPPIPLATRKPHDAQQVAVIGYPARDGRVADLELMESIFGDVYDRKRLAPGQVTGAERDVLLHDCSTLGGNSGSVVLDLETGEAVGLHFAGRFLEANYAVPAAVVRARVADVLQHRPGTSPHQPGGVVTDLPSAPAVPSAPSPDIAAFVEGVAGDYVDRKGYDPGFIGPKVPLPVLKRKADVLTFDWNGRKESELKYQHFSVVMSKSRRLCLFSAGNIDGNRPQRFKRPSWRIDPRIPKAQQIKEECYGDAPLFARGHMTRREDPIWGTPDEAALGNSDSMHVTNTVPQMQPFNAGIWLALESYALDHTRADRMRVSVFTGPFLVADDPVRAGVRIPRSFWKVIAFIHDATGALSATGYTMSQDAFLQPEEFVFGQHKTSQARIATIEQRAGLSFGPLAALDPFEGDEEGIEAPLTDPSQIQFFKRT